MSRYHVYAVGNALVDMEYSVDKDTLRAVGLEKGVMTLVDAEHQNRISGHLKDHRPHKGAGGSAANTVAAVAQLGGKAFYSCRVAGDPLGGFYVEDLRRAGVETNPYDESLQGDTGKCLVFVTPDADRTMATYLGVTGDLSMDALAPDAIRDSKVLYLEGYLVSSDVGRATAIEARKIAERAGVKTALTLSDPNMVKYFKPGLLEMIGGGVDLLFANEAEALGMTDTRDLEVAMADLKTLAKEFVVTRGPLGALIWNGGDLIEAPGVKVEAVDTVGAGDMYAGAFLYGYTHHWDHAKAGELAAACAGRLVTAYGPRLDQATVQEILQEHL